MAVIIIVVSVCDWLMYGRWVSEYKPLRVVLNLLLTNQKFKTFTEIFHQEIA